MSESSRRGIGKGRKLENYRRSDVQINPAMIRVSGVQEQIMG